MKIASRLSDLITPSETLWYQVGACSLRADWIRRASRSRARSECCPLAAFEWVETTRSLKRGAMAFGAATVECEKVIHVSFVESKSPKEFRPMVCPHISDQGGPMIWPAPLFCSCASAGTLPFSSAAWTLARQLALFALLLRHSTSSVLLALCGVLSVHSLHQHPQSFPVNDSRRICISFPLDTPTVFPLATQHRF